MGGAKFGGTKPMKGGDDMNLKDMYHPWNSHEAVEDRLLSNENKIAEFLQTSFVNGDTLEKAIHMFESYSSEHNMGMTLGVEKGEILERVLASKRPLVVLEFGSHIGDATLRILNSMKSNEINECILFSFESNPEWLGIGASIVRHVLQQSDVKCRYIPLILTSDISNLCEYVRSHVDDYVDAVFFDHVHSNFLNDLQILRKYNLLKDKTLLIADNALRHKYAMKGFIEYTRKNSNTFNLYPVGEPYPDEILVAEWKQPNSHDEL